MNNKAKKINIKNRNIHEKNKVKKNDQKVTPIRDNIDIDVDTSIYSDLSGTDLLVNIGLEEASNFIIDQFKRRYAVVEDKRGKRLLPIESTNYKDWLRVRYLEITNSSPKNIKNAIDMLGSFAGKHGEKVNLKNRLSKKNNYIYYDLLNEQREYIKIIPGDWEIVNGEDAPILFQRYPHQKAQVRPLEKGSGDPRKILDYVNINKNSDEALLFLVYLSTLFIPDIAHPILYLKGEHGSAKSTMSRIIQDIVDPSLTTLMSIPSKEDELIQKLSHDWLTIFDNVSKINSSTSDVLCRAVTGGSHSKRKLYTVDDDFIYKFKHCIIINSTGLKKVESDLKDRMITFDLERLDSSNRKSEQEVLEAFNNDKENILTGFIDAIAAAMEDVDDLEIEEYPRMADFFKWGIALSERLGYKKEDFKKAIWKNIEFTKNENLRNHKVFMEVINITVDKFDNEWEGTASELLELMNEYRSNYEDLDKNYHSSEYYSWPTNHFQLGKMLNECEKYLKIQYNIGLMKTRTQNVRKIRLYK